VKIDKIKRAAKVCEYSGHRPQSLTTGKNFFRHLQQLPFYALFSFGAIFFHNIHWPNSRFFGVFSKIEIANSPFSRKLGHFFVRLIADCLVLLSRDVCRDYPFSFPSSSRPQVTPLSGSSRLPGGSLSLALDNDFSHKDAKSQSFLFNCLESRMKIAA
jgi:hypothetical protein